MRRRWRLVMVVAALVVGAGAAALASVAANAATGSPVPWWPVWLPSMSDNYLRWLVGSVAITAASALFAWWAQRRYEHGLAELVPAVQRPEPWMVDRPVEVGQVVQAVLRRRRAGTVGITTAVHGAGGFGKTTVARLVRSDRRVLRRFDGRVYWVTLGRDARRGALVEKINNLVLRIDPGRAQPFTDVREAAEHLAAVLAEGPRRLIVLDDVWFDDQLAAFPVAGKCARLVTTRIPSLVAGQAVPVRVDQMSAEQSARLLAADLPALPTATMDALLAETGRWPLLLRLTNRNLVEQARSHADLAVVAQHLLERLHCDGPLRAAGQMPDVDDLSQLDIDDPHQRSKAVAATIEASAGLLTGDDRTRLAELSIFVEDEIIPVALVATLWQATEGLDETQTRMLCARLSNLALLTLTATDGGGTISLHDVIRDYLQEQLRNRPPEPRELLLDPVSRLHQLLLDTVSAALPCATTASGEVTAWWELPEQERYLREHLVTHLLAAQRHADAEALATELRWVQSRLQDVGPAGPVADLTQLGTPRVARLSRLLTQSAHLLTPTDPRHLLLDTLYSRVAHDPDWGPQTQVLARSRSSAAIINAWPLPDLPDAASRRVLTGHSGAARAVAMAPDGTWLASGGDDGTVRLWDAVTGAERAKLIGHRGRVHAVAIAPDGTWLASAGDDGRVSMWDAVTGAERTRLIGYRRRVHAVAIAPDGTWLASAGDDGAVWLWDAVTGARRATLIGHTGAVRAVAIAPDGSWLASAGDDGTVRLWDAVTGAEYAILTGHHRGVTAVAVAPDGSWLAGAGRDGTVRLWDAVTGASRAALFGDTYWMDAVAIAPDGSWLVSASGDGTVRLWDAVTGAQRAKLTGSRYGVHAVAIAPDGTWLASAGGEGAVRLWDAAVGAQRMEVASPTRGVESLAIAPDGSWLAGAGDDGPVWLWDAVTGAEYAILTGHHRGVTAVAVAPDGDWLASAGRDGTVRLWDAVTGAERATLTGHRRGVYAVAIAPNGTWLASGGEDGTVRLWDTFGAVERATLTGHAGLVRALAIAPDGTWLASAGRDGTVRLWDAVTGAQRAELAGHASWVHAVAIAPDGTWLVSAGGNGVVRLWDAVTGAERAKLTGHIYNLNAVAIAPDGAWLAGAGGDGTLCMWEVATGNCVAMVRTDKRLRTCAWSPAGTYQLMVGGDAGLYRFTFKPPIN